MPVIIDEHTQYFNNGAAVVNGFVYIGEVNTDPTIVANQLNLFSDAGLTVQVPNPQRTNARGQTLDGPIFIAEGLFSFELQNSGGVVLESIPLMGEAAGGLQAIVLSDVDGINDITALSSPTIVAYVDKQEYRLTIKNNNTGPVTLDINNVGVKPVVDPSGFELSPSTLFANFNLNVTFNGVFDRFQADNIITDSNPPGTSLTFRGSVAPFTYVFEDGATYDSVADTSFAPLFAVLSIAGVPRYGGTGADDFQVPDSRGRVDIGLDNLGGTPANRMVNPQADILGGSGGSETVTLTGSQIASHTHTGPNHTHTGPNHTHSIPSNNTGGSPGSAAGVLQAAVINSSINTNPAGTGATGAAGTGNTGTSGSGAPHPNDQPWLAATKIIKK